jgi:glycerol-3-phosphate dehydrogenase
LGEIELVISGLPMSAIEDFCSHHKNELNELFKKNIPLVNLAKGIDHETLKLPSELFNSHFENYRSHLMYLSGPSFAKEIIDKQITLVSLAGEDREKLLRTCEMLGTDFFKAVPTTDVKGVQLGGSLKNVIAIAGGIGQDFDAAFFAQIQRVARHFGNVHAPILVNFHGYRITQQGFGSYQFNLESIRDLKCGQGSFQFIGYWRRGGCWFSLASKTA